jgi:hypothetical protein
MIPLFLQTLMGYNATMPEWCYARNPPPRRQPFVGLIIQRYDGAG